MDLKDDDFSSDISDEITFKPTIKCQANAIYTSSEEEHVSSDSSNDTSSRDFFRKDFLTSSDSEDEKSHHNDISDKDWSDPTGNQPRVTPFEGKSGLKLSDEGCTKVEDFYQLLVTNELFQRIADQTNLYAAQVLSLNQSKRLNEWRTTDSNEIKRFLGLIMWMGLVKLPHLNLYWSRDPAFAQTFPRDIMSRNRFELILRVLHFSNNEEQNSFDCLYKVRPIIDALNENCQKYYEPGELLRVDELLIPFGGRIIFQQYTKQNTYKYGANILKLCSASGYTHAFRVYCGRKSDVQRTARINTVVSLCENVFGRGHTICTDDRHTSIELATKLIAANTHLVGVVRWNQRGIPKEVVKKKLKPREMFAKEHKNGMTLLKWKDKRDVLLLSTKHSSETVNVTKRGQERTKPKVIVDYNEGKSFVDMSDQMAVYSGPLRRSVNWYKNLAFELLLNTCVVNAWVMYKARNNSISLIEFKKQLSGYLTHCQDDVVEDDKSFCTDTIIKKKRHEMKKKDGRMESVRRRCSLCYKKNVEKFGSQKARNCTIKVATFCDDCPDKPHLCLTCFNTKHRSMSP